MWFKNLQVYRLTKPWELSPEALDELLQQHAFAPCTDHQPASYGWVSPLDSQNDDQAQTLVHAASGYIMLCARQQEKIMPAGVINERLEEKLQHISTQEQRKPGRKEKLALKEDIIFEMLPRAFSRSRKHYAYIDTTNDMLVINSSSESGAEQLINTLRDTIGSLPVVPLAGNSIPSQVMTHWLKQGCPQNITLGADCELGDIQEKSSRISCRGQNLLSDEILSHLQGGMMVTRLGIEWKDRLSCVITDKLGIRRLKFTDVVQEEAGNADDKWQQFDNDFAIMTLELSDFLRNLAKAFQ